MGKYIQLQVEFGGGERVDVREIFDRRQKTFDLNAREGQMSLFEKGKREEVG
jgi:hypothetical protein